ncbi:hypothetical protein AVEN_93676-1 [Araneus ventricosus]|uniref:Uncharacterized protein n=1 Tax=Araneus ventricosus TaxID=182803 RepID=A0A4Y2QVQ1_ARAVE|nr:hypothetical protein AVEN_93676-1 [Araneus ventricosus]
MKKLKDDHQMNFIKVSLNCGYPKIYQQEYCSVWDSNKVKKNSPERILLEAHVTPKYSRFEEKENIQKYSINMSLLPKNSSKKKTKLTFRLPRCTNMHTPFLTLEKWRRKHKEKEGSLAFFSSVACIPIAGHSRPLHAKTGRQYENPMIICVVRSKFENPNSLKIHMDCRTVKAEM